METNLIFVAFLALNFYFFNFRKKLAASLLEIKLNLHTKTILSMLIDLDDLFLSINIVYDIRNLKI